MSVTINLKFRDNDGNTKQEKREITPLNGFGFINMMKVVNTIMKEMKENDSLKGLFSSLFGGQDVKDIDLAQVNTQILMKAVNSFETLFVSLPDQAYELLSALTRIDAEELKSQDILDLMDIYDSVLEVNDVEKIINRVKKSLALTGAKIKFLQVAKEAAS